MYAPSGSAAIAGPVEEHRDLQVLPCHTGAAFNGGKVHEEATPVKVYRLLFYNIIIVP